MSGVNGKNITIIIECGILGKFMKHERKLPQSVRYEYCEESKVKLNYAHGVWGGVNPRGEIELNFYSESDKAPEYVECLVDAHGTLGPELVPEGAKQRTIVRTIHNKVLLNYHTAYAVMQWLEEQLESLDAVENASFMDDETGIEQ